jgi:hypothetical protein
VTTKGLKKIKVKDLRVGDMFDGEHKVLTIFLLCGSYNVWTDRDSKKSRKYKLNESVWIGDNH